ncbi:VOC family protein [uncultured Draconibacterium sp.]|uniref:VOC family protein n=1 Tax=uncultured Draconibacterium sp. TaxID=1573823 RepID=UPI002AA9508A|nr:VOC family protein [uncultured Draconibacterium sp.]
MQPSIDHIEITVKDLEETVSFYDQFLPLLGFSLDKKTAAYIASHEKHVVEYSHPNLCIALTSPRESLKDEAVHRRRPGALHHLAFKAETRKQVDMVHGKLVEMNADIVSAPRLYPEYHPNYYAVFFKAPDGIKFEVVCQKVE